MSSIYISLQHNKQINRQSCNQDFLTCCLLISKKALASYINAVAAPCGEMDLRNSVLIIYVPELVILFYYDPLHYLRVVEGLWFMSKKAWVVAPS